MTQKLPVSREEFCTRAKPMKALINNIPLLAVVKEFSTGSVGWHLDGVTSIEVDGQLMSVQIGLNLTIIGSKDWPKESKPALPTILETRPPSRPMPVAPVQLPSILETRPPSRPMPVAPVQPVAPAASHDSPTSCAKCGDHAVTKTGGPLCLACLRAWVSHETPMIGCFKGLQRTRDHKEALEPDASPWQQNAIRALEER